MTLDIFFDRYALTLHAFVVAFALLVYVGVARALPQRRDPSAAVAWVVSLALLPYLVLPLYFMFGSRKLLMRESETPPAPPLHRVAHRRPPRKSAERNRPAICPASHWHR